MGGGRINMNIFHLHPVTYSFPFIPIDLFHF